MVRWGCSFSRKFSVSSGVRQGGILSPLLFNIYVNDVLVKLEKSKRGCFIGSLCCNSFMYADDLIILAISLADLQYLSDLCMTEFSDIGLIVNKNKTFCLRIGPRHHVSTTDITINEIPIKWANEIAYLGIMILSAKTFKVNIQRRKQQFFRSLNAILGKIGTFSSPSVVLSLVESFCVPVLLYGLECVNLTAACIRSIENAYSQVYSKIFNTYNKDIIEQCKFFMGQLPAALKIVNKKCNFLAKSELCNNIYGRALDVNRTELCSIVRNFGYVINGNLNTMSVTWLSRINWKSMLFKHFETSLKPFLS